VALFRRFGFSTGPRATKIEKTKAAEERRTPCWVVTFEQRNCRTGSEKPVSFYSKSIFPRLCNMLLNNPIVAARRREILASTRGDVLEIGFGTGLNLPCYPEVVRKLTTVDPNVGMNSLALKRVKQTGIEVDQRILSGETLPFENTAFDTVVCTFTLCSIANVARALGEVYRVLKPGGQFLFLEHGKSPDSKVQKWQHRLNWLQMRLGDGCRLDRDIRGIVAAQPFASVRIDNFYMEKTPRTHGYMFMGTAMK
jgi:SAM-dependent methyltransferase